MLRASRVIRRFGSVTAVDELDLAVGSGQLFCLLGANGAGKTTTINLFLGFLAADAGTVVVGGVNPAVDPKAARRQLAYIPENVALYPHLSGIETIDLFCRMAGARLEPPALEALLERSGLDREQARRRVSSYSKGMRQKVGLAIAYARRAEGLVLDEPLSGLDPAAASDFCAELGRIRETGAAVLMTTHDLFRAKELGGTIGIMRAGRLVEQLEAKDVDARELERIYLHHMRNEPAAAPSERVGASA
ncbi:MAG: ABC transporter ATP-binding protein [Myxococcota bacterium]